MSFLKGKQKYSRDEIIDILKRNANVYKDDEQFTQYVIDLAAFLVEYRLHALGETAAVAKEKEKAKINSQRQWLSRTRDRDLELERVLRKHASPRQQNANCRMCGAPSSGRLMCPHCGNMT